MLRGGEKNSYRLLVEGHLLPAHQVDAVSLTDVKKLQLGDVDATLHQLDHQSGCQLLERHCQLICTGRCSRGGRGGHGRPDGTANLLIGRHHCLLPTHRFLPTLLLHRPQSLTKFRLLSVHPLLDAVQQAPLRLQFDEGLRHRVDLG